MLDGVAGSLFKLNNFSEHNYTGIHFDSRFIEKGNIFVAITGNASDGHSFIEEAIKKGALAIVGEKDIKGLPIPYIKVENSRKALGTLAAKFYNNPSEKHTVIAVTGTNGKTTTSYLIKHILNLSGETCSLFGTVAHYVNGEKITAINTTPDAIVLQKLLAQSNDKYVVMEASSHGIHQHRLEGTSIDYGLFTNLSHDHLDYHGNLESYFNVKAQLFQLLIKNGEAIIGTYTKWGSELKEQLLKCNKIALSFGEKESDDVQLLNIERLDKPIFHISDGNRKYRLFSPLPGIHNVWNTMQAYLTGRRLGLDPEEIIVSLQSFQGVPGRFEQYSHPTDAKFIIDYAHTPEAIEYCLEACKSLSKGKIIHIFGFRGKRDKTKRAKMLQTSLHSSDQTIITLDDLNGEDIDEMCSYIDKLLKKYDKSKWRVILDRTEAIKYAWQVAKGGDIVLITGKGPEQYERSFVLPSTTDRGTLMHLHNYEKNGGFLQ